MEFLHCGNLICCNINLLLNTGDLFQHITVNVKSVFSFKNVHNIINFIWCWCLLLISYILLAWIFFEEKKRYMIRIVTQCCLYVCVPAYPLVSSTGITPIWTAEQVQSCPLEMQPLTWQLALIDNYWSMRGHAWLWLFRILLVDNWNCILYFSFWSKFIVMMNFDQQKKCNIWRLDPHSHIVKWFSEQIDMMFSCLTDSQ